MSVYTLILNGVLMNIHLDSTVWVDKHSGIAFVSYSLWIYNFSSNMTCSYSWSVQALKRGKKKSALPQTIKAKRFYCLHIFLVEFSYFHGIVWKHVVICKELRMSCSLQTPRLVKYLVFLLALGCCLPAIHRIWCCPFFSFVLGLLPRLPVLYYYLIFLYFSCNFFSFCWPPDKTPFIPTISYSLVLAFYLWILCHRSTKKLSRSWHLAVPFGLWLLFPHYKCSSDITPFLFLCAWIVQLWTLVVLFWVHAVLSEILPPFRRPFASHVKMHSFTGWFRSKFNFSFNMQKHNTKSGPWVCKLY